MVDEFKKGLEQIYIKTFSNLLEMYYYDKEYGVAQNEGNNLHILSPEDINTITEVSTELAKELINEMERRKLFEALESNWDALKSPKIKKLMKEINMVAKNIFNKKLNEIKKKEAKYENHNF